MAVITVSAQGDSDYDFPYVMRKLMARGKAVEGVEVTFEGKDDYHPTSVTLTGPGLPLTHVFDFFYADEDEVTKAANHIAYVAVRNRVESAVKEITENVKDGTIADEEALYEWIDGQCEFYYDADAAAYIANTTNADAYESNVGQGPPNICVQAAYAMSEDVRDALWPNSNAEDFLADLSPLTDTEKADALAFVTEQRGNYDESNEDELHYDAADSVTDNDVRKDRIVEYLDEQAEVTTTA